MNKILGGLTILILATCLISGRAMAQGPAGAGAAAAAGNSSTSRSYNPVKWFGKKDNNAAPTISVEELDKKLEPRLRSANVLAPNAALKDVCSSFMERLDCVAALRASHELNLNFECVRSTFTGVRVGTDSSCRMPADDKPLNLTKTIHFLKSDVDAKSAAKTAEAEAREDLQEATRQ